MDYQRKREIILGIINIESQNIEGITDKQKETLLEEFMNSGDTYENLRSQIIDRLKYIEGNNKKIEESPKTLEESIAEEYGVNSSEIEHRRLDDGTEVFKFYDKKTNKHILIQNLNPNISMNDQFQMQQQEIEAAKGEDEGENALEIMNYQRMHGNEIPLIPINELQNYDDQIRNLNGEQLEKVTALAKKEKELDIQYINIEHCIGIDSMGKLLEARLDKTSGEYVVDSPKEYTDNEKGSKISIVQEDSLEYQTESETSLDKEQQTMDSEIMQQDLPKTLVKRDKKRYDQAAYVDAVILAFIVGCVSGLFAMILIRIISNT